MVPKIVSLAASVVAHNRKTVFESQAEALVRKVSDILHQPAFRTATPTCPLQVWKGGREQRRVYVLQETNNYFYEYYILLRPF